LELLVEILLSTRYSYLHVAGYVFAFGVCLSVWRITQQVMDEFSRNFWTR